MRIKFTEEEKRLFDKVRPYAATKGWGLRPDAPPEIQAIYARLVEITNQYLSPYSIPIKPIHKDSCDLSGDNQDN
ncbi:hypothetical protein QU660_06805 [Stomatobaculum sp. F0698]|uniref:hypothetical protein n=1 Tax=Stomatobaculum sp. F0698 TaxID=3059030 RepID=UPI00272DADB1|nr:hypothetical protein [Stomatobaculum sp. F0698]WLD86204.1 hypothetical protein QU660_06805 [Stomatobaculum sp. F0698]